MSAPEPTHSSDGHETSHLTDSLSLDGHHHDAPEIDLVDHCHPGLDCFFQAIVVVQAIPEPQYEIGRLSVVASDKGRKGTIRGFDPPPPRRLC